MNVRLGYASVEPVMPPPPPEDFIQAGGKPHQQQQPPSLSTADRTSFVQMYREAMALFDLGKWEGAEGAFRNLLRLAPLSEIYLLLGYTFFYRGDFQRAGHHFDKAAKKDPNNIAAHFSLALAYNRQRKPGKAVGAVLKVVRLEPENAAAANSICVARITGAELTAAITRKVRNGEVSTSDAATAIADFRYDFDNQYNVLEVTEQVVSKAMDLIQAHPLRGYDGVQLAAAVELNTQFVALSIASGVPPPGLSSLVLVSSDNDLNSAASAEGLTVEDPRNHP